MFSGSFELNKNESVFNSSFTDTGSDFWSTKIWETSRNQYVQNQLRTTQQSKYQVITDREI